MKQGKYVFRSGSRLPKEHAESTGKAIEKLRGKKGGQLKAADVVESARPVKSPLHWAFEWDDTKAAEEYRLTQGRHLLRSIEVIMVDNGKEQRYPAFVSVTLTSENEADGVDGDAPIRETHYRTITEAMEDPDSRAALLEQAKREMESFRRKYAQLTELAEVFAALDRVAA